MHHPLRDCTTWASCIYTLTYKAVCFLLLRILPFSNIFSGARTEGNNWNAVNILFRFFLNSFYCILIPCCLLLFSINSNPFNELEVVGSTKNWDAKTCGRDMVKFRFVFIRPIYMQAYILTSSSSGSNRQLLASRQLKLSTIEVSFFVLI